MPDDAAPGRLSGLPYGTAEEANARLTSARQTSARGGPAASRRRSTPGAASSVRSDPPRLPGVFSSPTSRPDEPITASDPVVPEDLYASLRAAYRAYPSPELERLLERASRG